MSLHPEMPLPPPAATPAFELPGLLLGPKCYECPAVDVCPAMLFARSVKELNADLGLVRGTDTEDRVRGEVFAYGIGKFAKEVAHAQQAVNDCPGGVSITLTEKANDFTQRRTGIAPAFGNTEIPSGHALSADVDQLAERGYKVIDTGRGVEVRPENGLELTIATSIYSGNRGLAQIDSFRAAASPDRHKEAVGKLLAVVENIPTHLDAIAQSRR